MTGTGAEQAFAATGLAATALVPAGQRTTLTQMVLHAHYQGDVDELRRLCLRAEAGLAPLGLSDLTDEQLQERVRAIHVLLAGANDEIQRRGMTRSQRQSAERTAWLETERAKARPLDPSDAHPFG